jgi:gamma-glutamyltranspeptidase/glutathione hydrolase
MRKIIVPIIGVFLHSSFVFAIPFKGSEVVITAQNPIATHAGQRVAELGGNVVDVAVATVLAMSATNPTNSTLGGGGFALVRVGKKVEVLDFRERAPQATHPDYFKHKNKDASITGGAAVAVPGLPAGLFELHKRHGKLHWSRLFDEAIRLAQKGFRVSGELSDDYKTNLTRFNSGAKKHFLKNGLEIYKPGEVQIQKGLAKVLSEMRNRNIVSFYNGPVAKDIVQSVQQAGGEISLKDLQSYKPVWREPLVTEYAGHKLYLMPPPSSGGLVIKTALALIEKLEVAKLPVRSVDEFHMLGEILSRSFRSRMKVADPDFYSVPMDQLVGTHQIDELAKSIKISESTTLPPLTDSDGKEKPQTTHLSVLDKFGNAVAMTITLNGDFGSAVATENYGIMLNNEMDDFTTKPGEPNMFGLVQGQANVVSPGKRPLSSMSPTLVEKSGKIVMVVGAPGGPRIISSVLQVLYRTLGRNQDLEVAVESPRVHHQHMPNKLLIDADRFTPETIKALRDRKHIVEESWQARVYAARLKDGVLEAVVDTRGEGVPAGY